jgi:hypothetical protein
MSQAKRHLLIAALNAFWIFAWSPGLYEYFRSGERPRPEDVFNPICLMLGIALELLIPRMASYFNSAYYLGYAAWLLFLAISRSNDVHQALAFIIVGVPYVGSAALILWLHYRTLHLVRLSRRK